MRQLRPGQLVRVDSTDPVAILDVPAMAREDGHLVQDVERDGDVARFFIRRGAA
ncbi:MAG: sulfurtransferase TusA family protein [Cohaesibacteraceae bacterium]